MFMHTVYRPVCKWYTICLLGPNKLIKLMYNMQILPLLKT